MLVPKTVSDLLTSVEDEQMLQAMIDQLNKDYSLANIDYRFENDLTALNLKKVLTESLNQLVSYRYDDYLSLMYRIDVSEKELHNILQGNQAEHLERLTFVVLKRIYKKVWFRSRL